MHRFHKVQSIGYLVMAEDGKTDGQIDGWKDGFQRWMIFILEGHIRINPVKFGQNPASS